MKFDQTHVSLFESSEPPCSCDYITPWILSYIAKKNITSILDVGCGNGALCKKILKFNNNIKIVGIDHDQKGIDFAKLNCPNGSFYCLGLHENVNDILNMEKHCCCCEKNIRKYFIYAMFNLFKLK